MKDNIYATSYNIFISDHNSIVARIASKGSRIKLDIKERMFFTQEKHMKSASSKESELFDRKLMMNTSKSQDHNEDETINKRNSYKFNKQPISFSRKFHNIDGNEDEMMDIQMTLISSFQSH